MSNMKTLEGKTALVTGAGRGIGRAIALALAAKGADVCVASRTLPELEEVSEGIRGRGRKALATACDLRNEAEIHRLVRSAEREFGRIDILVNNAGIGYFAPVRSMTTEQFDAMWSVNVRAAFLVTREVLPGMMERASGDIVNIASLAGRNAFVGGAGYASTKWALIGFARSLMLEVRERNIRVVTVCPGSVDAAFGDHAGREIRSPGVIPTAEDIAAVVIDTLSMPRYVMVSEVDVRPTNPKG